MAYRNALHWLLVLLPPQCMSMISMVVVACGILIMLKLLAEEMAFWNERL